MKFDIKNIIIKTLPFVLIGLFATKLGQAYRLADGAAFTDKIMNIGGGFSAALENITPSFHPFDLMIGASCCCISKAVINFKGKNAKKYRKDIEYGSAQWSA
jgi:type IV secretion system protein VirD4